MQGLALAEDAGQAEKTATPGETVLKLKDYEDLGKIGGFQVIDTEAGRVIVARIDADNFAACSAVCTHRGCEVGYSADTKEFVCPCHGARFSENGKVKGGPTKRDLQSYTTDSAAVIELKPLTK